VITQSRHDHCYGHTRFQCRIVRLPRTNRDDQEQKRSKITILDSKCNLHRGKSLICGQFDNLIQFGSSFLLSKSRCQLFVAIDSEAEVWNSPAAHPRGPRVYTLPSMEHHLAASGRRPYPLSPSPSARTRTPTSRPAECCSAVAPDVPSA
jgi:hypothetical protein